MQRTVAQRTRHASGLITALCAGVLLAGCTALQIEPPAEATSAAQALAATGDHLGASRAYLDLALDASGAQRQRYLLFAAGELYQANDLDGAERILQQAGTDIAPENRAVWAEVTAELRLARRDPQGALNALNQITSTTSQSAAVRILLLRSEALFQLGNPDAAVTTLLRREAVLERRGEREANQRLIWSGLQTTGASIPPAPVARDGNPIVTGWLQLGRIAFEQRSSLNGLYAALEQWQRENSRHPASGALLDDVLANLRELSSYPHQVALLLPLSGQQGAIGQAIRDGYLAAHFDLGNNSERPDIRFYDTAAAQAATLYQRAALDGATFVIGPLLKPEVADIAPLVTAVTTLALNTAPDDVARVGPLYQFALAPEDEARAVARRAVADGLVNALALVPDSPRGLRILAAFEAELGRQGGRLLTARTYAPDVTDFSTPIQDALLLDESYARRDRLAANLGQQLEFEPRRRQDVDFIFVVGSPQVGKLIKPQLRFHYAGDLPTYATAAIYQPGSTDNKDLNGIQFPDIPWLLEPGQNVSEHQSTLQAYWGANAARLARFYALGYDAYHLTAMLAGRDRDSLDMNGMTGRLSVDRNGVLHRDLKWAQIERGATRTLPDTPRPLAQESELRSSAAP